MDRLVNGPISDNTALNALRHAQETERKLEGIEEKEKGDTYIFTSEESAERLLRMQEELKRLNG